MMIEFAGDIDAGTRVDVGMVHGKKQVEERLRQASLQTKALDDEERKGIQRRRADSVERFREKSREDETRASGYNELQARLARRRAASEGVHDSGDAGCTDTVAGSGPQHAEPRQSSAGFPLSQRGRSSSRQPRKIEGNDERSGASNELEAVLARRRTASSEKVVVVQAGFCDNITAEHVSASSASPRGQDDIVATSHREAACSAEEKGQVQIPVAAAVISSGMLADTQESEGCPDETCTGAVSSKSENVLQQDALLRGSVVVRAAASPCRARQSQVGGSPDNHESPKSARGDVKTKPEINACDEGANAPRKFPVSASRLDACEVQPDVPQEPKLELEPAAADGVCQQKCCVIA